MSKEKHRDSRTGYTSSADRGPEHVETAESPEVAKEAEVAAGDNIQDYPEIDINSSPEIKYRADQAKRHYRRLRGIGYDHDQALYFCDQLYKLAESYRDVLKRRKPIAPTPVQKGFQQESAELSAPVPAVPTVGQKIVTPDDFGRVAFVGIKFVSVEWLKTGKRERIALSRFQELASGEHLVSLPQVRTARRNSSALREGENG